ncbi:MAG: ABC transporter ATP-binding protein [Actinomycetes bacterium]|jgi:peptide/nickel transport system ATP-binding protein
MALLEFDDVSVTYRSRGADIPAVRGVTLSVNAGESLGLAGESGCGKTTLTSTVLRMQPKSAKVTGEIRLNGDNILDMTWGQVRALRWAEASIVFQGAMHALNPVQKIGDQLSEPILLHSKVSKKDADRRVGELLEMVGLPARRAEAYPHQLSGGQKQRVMIAMALACGPQLIIADEPTTALDVMVQAQVLNVLQGLVKELNVGMVFISHDLSVLSSTCDRIAVMYAGKIIEQGPAADVFDHPQHPYAGALAGAFPRIGDTRYRYSPSGLPGDPPFPGDLPSGCTFHPRCPVAVDRCSTTEPHLVKHASHETACLLVGSEIA